MKPETAQPPPGAKKGDAPAEGPVAGAPAPAGAPALAGPPTVWTWLPAVLMLLALAVVSVFTVDAAVVGWVHRAGIDAGLRKSGLTGVLRLPGYYPFTLAVAAVLWFAHPLGWRAAGLLALAGALSGLNQVCKWMAGRTRPDHRTGEPHFDFAPFQGGPLAIFTRPNLAFPSGDVTLAFASAACLAAFYPRWRWAFYAVALWVAVERVGENAHHVSDVLAGMALGIAAFHLAWRLGHRFARPRSVRDAGPCDDSVR